VATLHRVGKVRELMLAQMPDPSTTHVPHDLAN